MAPANLFDLVEESQEWLKARGFGGSHTAVILGSGLSTVVSKFNIIRQVNYAEIPHVAQGDVMSHQGILYQVDITGTTVLVFAGRIHYYEGYEMWQVGYPVRLAAALGVSTLFTTGAAGGLNPKFQSGDLVLLSDHINLMPANPLRGPHDERFGVKFPDMSEPYDLGLRQEIMKIGRSLNVPLHHGVYAALPGPSLETRSEYAYLHNIGADLVAMSIVPEVIVAIQARLKVIAMCVVSNVAYPPSVVRKTTMDDVVRVVQDASEQVTLVLRSYLSYVAKRRSLD